MTRSIIAATTRSSFPRSSADRHAPPDSFSPREKGEEMSSRLYGVLLRTAVALTLFVLAASPARAQLPESGSGELNGFTVAGKGTAAAKPNRLEIDLEVSAASELSADAIVKYRDAKKRLEEAFAALKLPNVAVEERALAVDQKGQMVNPYYMEMPVARKGKIEVQLSRKLVVTCKDVRALDEESLLQLVAKLLDVAQDAGAKVGGTSDYNPYYGRYGNGGNALVRFILDDFDTLQDKAYQAAIADAKSRAARLAKLSGVEVGRVAGVREIRVPGEKPQQTLSMIMYNYGSTVSDDEEPPHKQIEASKFHEIPVIVELQVRFDVAPARSAPARASGGGK